MTDEVHSDVPPVAHAVEDLPEALDIAGRDVGDAGLEADRGNEVGELDGLELLARHLLCFQPVAPLALELRRIACPLAVGLVVIEVALDGLADRRVDDLCGRNARRGQESVRKQ
jgi:hypothetical protein